MLHISLQVVFLAAEGSILGILLSFLFCLNTTIEIKCLCYADFSNH